MTAPKKPPVSVPVVTNSSGYTETLKSPTRTVGTVTSGYGPRRQPTKGASTYHKGLDIAAPTGTPVYAAASGKVTFAGVQGGYGNHIVIRHDDNTETTYSHLSSILVSQGQNVAQGEVIGKIGSSGTATGPHLHYEVHENGVAINPSKAGSVTVDSNNRSRDEKKTVENQTAKYSDEFVDKIAELAYNQDEILKSLVSGDHFQDNPSNDFYNLTYHWKFYITSDTEVLSQDALTPNSNINSFYENLAQYEQIIIAESGVTGFSIDSVNMDAIVGTEFQTGSTLFTKIEMKITEPNGAVFLDALRNSALQLGVQNYQKTFYYLELTFKGYDEDGNIVLKPFPNMPNGGKWLWTVIITDIQVGMSAGGGTYTLSLTPMSDSLTVGRFNVIPISAQISGSTVGEYMTNLCKTLNQHYEVLMAEPNIITYDVAFHDVKDVMTADQVKAMPIVPSNVDVNEERSLAFAEDGKSAVTGKGFLISDAVDAIMMSCERAQKLAIDALGDTIDLSKETKTGHRQSILWRVEPEIHHTGYDPLYNEYCKKITIHIYGFRNHAGVLNAIEQKSDESVQQSIIADMAYRNFLPKKYEYIFTGKNSEVLDIDLSFNTNWAAVLPLLAESTVEQGETHAIALEDDTKNKQTIGLKRNEPKSSSEIAATQVQDATAYKEAVAEREAKQRERDEKIKAKEWTDEDEKEFKELQKKQIESNVRAYKAGKDARAERLRLRANQPYVSPSKAYERAYADDLTSQSQDYQETFRKAYPITVQYFDPTTVSGATGQYHAGQSTYGAVLNQVYGPLATQFFQIEMTVRGDPYWIGAGSFEQLITQKTGTFVSGQPNFSEGCNAFLFKMAYPLGQDDNGELLLNVNETVTGIYQVNSISHRFEDGKFTQVLKGLRIPLLDIYRSLYKKINPEQFSQPEDNK